MFKKVRFLRMDWEWAVVKLLKKVTTTKVTVSRIYPLMAGAALLVMLMTQQALVLIYRTSSMLTSQRVAPVPTQAAAHLPLQMSMQATTTPSLSLLVRTTM